MRHYLSFIFAALSCGSLALGQTLTIQTFAGGGVAQNIPATSASLGNVTEVAVDAAGNIYMVLNQYSVVARMDVGGNLTVVAGNGTPGYSGDGGAATSAQLNFPVGIAVDGSGNLYIGDSANNRVRKVSNGVITTVAGNLASAQLSNPTGVAVDGSGVLYIADTNNNVIRRVSNGAMTSLVTGLTQPQGVAVDTSGNLYITDASLGGLVRKFTNGALTTLGTLSGASGIAVDTSGNLYITSSLSFVLKVTGAAGVTIAGTGVAGYSGDGGSAINALLNTPVGVAVDTGGSVYIADNGNAVVRKVAGGNISTIAGGGTLGSVNDNGPALSGELSQPSDVAVDAAGNLYIADTGNNRVRMVSSANGSITTVAGIGAQGSQGDNGPANAARLSAPTGVAVDSSGNNLYIADFGNNRVRKVTNGVITTVAGTGTGGFSGDGNPATSAALFGPAGVDLDSAGNLYIADFYNNRVRKVTTNGVISTVAGTGTGGSSGDGNAATSATLFGPVGVVVDSSGNLYIADDGNNRIRMVAGGTITTVAGNGTAGYSGDGGTATSAQINAPQGVGLDAAGNLLIADSNNHVIRSVSGGVITTLAGNGTPGFSGDAGPATSAQMNSPQGVTADTLGRIYIADSFNNLIRAVIPACNYVVSPTLLSPDAGGGTFNVAVQTDQFCSWTVTQLPSWITVSGASTITGAGSARLVVAANAVAARSATITVAGTPVTVNQATCTYAVNPGGQGFGAAGGSGVINLTTASICPWTVTNTATWITLGRSSGTGSAAISFTASSNTLGTFRSSSVSVGGVAFTVEEAPGLSIGLQPVGSLAQVTSAGTWKMTLNYLNLGSAPAVAQLNFFNDPDGAAMPLPMTFPQTAGTGSLVASTLDRNLNPNAQLVIESTGPDSQTALVGWGQLQATGNITGFGIFTNSFFHWEAVVPLETRNSSSYLLAFDNTGVLATGLAIANLASQAAVVPVVFHDDAGGLLGNASINLSANGHTSFTLKDKYPQTIGKRGTVEFGTPAGGQISVLGLRANGAALTTLPVLADVGTGGGLITHVALNGGFTTTFTLVNTSTTAAPATLSFFKEDGTPLPIPLILPQSGATLTTSALTRTLAPGASLLVSTQAQDSLPQIVGSAQLTTTGNVSGFAIFNWTTFGQEASVPLETRAASSYFLAFDNTGGLTTGVALANAANTQASVNVNLRDDTGALLGTNSISLAAQGHTSFLLPDNYAAVAGKRGTVEFVTPAGGRISVIGLRAKSDGTLTTLPVLTR